MDAIDYILAIKSTVLTTGTSTPEQKLKAILNLCNEAVKESKDPMIHGSSAVLDDRFKRT